MFTDRIVCVGFAGCERGVLPTETRIYYRHGFRSVDRRLVSTTVLGVQRGFVIGGGIPLALTEY